MSGFVLLILLGSIMGSLAEAAGWTAFGCAVLIVVSGTGIALGRINKSLKREPMQLLSERCRE